MLGSCAIPAWREFTAAPHVGPHARYAVYAWDQGPEPDEKDIQWLATESAAAALDAKGPGEALCVVWESVRGEDLAGRLAVVYPSEENPQEPEKFNLTEVNRKLAKLGR